MTKVTIEVKHRAGGYDNTTAVLPTIADQFILEMTCKLKALMCRIELSISGIAQLRACLGSLGLTPAHRSGKYMITLGQSATLSVSKITSASPSKADILRENSDFRSVPTGDITFSSKQWALSHFLTGIPLFLTFRQAVWLQVC